MDTSSGTHPQDTGVLPDWMRVRNAMKMVLKHKGNAHQVSSETLDMLAETATKTMWLIEEENERKNKP